MNTTSEFSRLVDDLAAHWTEPALEILKDAGLRNIRVSTELQIWRTLRKVLHQELSQRRSLRVSTQVSLTMLMSNTLRRGARLIAASKLDATAFDFENRIRSLAADKRSTEAERRLYSDIIRQTSVHSAFKPLSRTDYVPRLRVTAVAS